MANEQHFDAIVIGAGFGGLYALKKLRDDLGLKVRVYDKAGGVGGTWYWNRYPGAMSDTEAFVYQFSFDKDMLQECDWKNRYWNQPDILAYLQGVVERHDLGKDIQLNTAIESLVFDDASNNWTITTGDGGTVTARYVVCALGLLSKINLPDIKGRDSFRG
jgi:cation diffusion facilitator CzcD-associated flavoprotein CzcO